MAINNHISIKNTRSLLSSKLLSQPLLTDKEDPNLLNETIEFIRKLSAHEGNICILSDLKARKSYLFYNAVAQKIGLMQGEFEIESIWEDELLDLIHPEDVEKKYKLELSFFNVCKSMDEQSRKGNELITTLRIKSIEGNYVQFKHRLIYFDKSEAGDMVLALCLYNLVIEYPGCEAPNGVIVNLRSGKVISQGVDGLSEILSLREKQIMQLIKLGDRSKDIAEKLSLSIHTVNRHRQNIFNKLNVTNAIEACRVADKAGLFL